MGRRPSVSPIASAAVTPEGLGQFPVQLEIRVAWRDMDANGHVNNAVFVRWFEDARIEYFHRCPALISGIQEHKQGPILRRQEIEYRTPVTYPDTVRVRISVTKLGDTSFEMACRIESERVAGEVATANGTAVMLDLTRGTPIPIPADVRRDFLALEGKAVS